MFLEHPNIDQLMDAPPFDLSLSQRGINDSSSVGGF